jgi:antitoxin ParD1/3/4
LILGKLAIFANRSNKNGLSKKRLMPTRNVNLTDELDHFVLQEVESGRYENASEVVRAALRTLEREEQRHEAKLTALRTPIDEGDASGIADDNVFERVREKLNLPSTPR